MLLARMCFSQFAVITMKSSNGKNLRYWPFVRGIHLSPVNFPHKGQWHGALVFFFICALINGWVNNREAGDSRRHRAQYDAMVMLCGLREKKLIFDTMNYDMDKQVLS